MNKYKSDSGLCISVKKYNQTSGAGVFNCISPEYQATVHREVTSPVKQTSSLHIERHELGKTKPISAEGFVVLEIALPV